ncbi:NADPH:quinone reductase-like Zn-dependent oxidoreductase [Herbaspirillum sp. Sphag1AN]|uniref:zinc-dependent alcohol dehydrogenase family protein n=1 Tax=unclassified Herbaspirillum TaxID=2624150 RepID=UPI001614E79B|nr:MULTISPECIES: zinc-dependent alcohol dehydrogenase family protein [unclassified Herbaspirillum]MBB3214880.1 NADPH:quinone reductase-like Zn-dependent oxidoreductase [Herbaspirillum sp. Sphag1AN]MBB3248074.1 NADPH:quinone reductase-like Zn-dependent oxidoreductase [Herbaspirillum sp. Sphag64]
MTSSANTTMRAYRLENFATPIRATDITLPTPGPREVLVRIHASGLNPLDTKIRAGKAAHAQIQLPAVLGLDMAGVVVAVGDEVSEFSAGDAVYGLIGGVGKEQGSQAEFAAVDVALLAHQPGNISMREAAALPLIFITAWEGLVDHANVHAGQKVLIHGGAGGVGHIAVQIALALGADVYATGSASQRDLITSYGATFIDYQTTSVEQYVDQYTAGEGFDIVYDTVGGTTLDASFAVARRYRGHVISILGWGNHSLAPLSFRSASYSGVFTLWPLLSGKDRAHQGEILRHASRLTGEGKIRVELDPRRFQPEQIDAAYDLMEAGTTRGKVVVEFV